MEVTKWHVLLAQIYPARKGLNIYGIGRPTATKILQETGISPDVRVKDLTEEQVSLLREYIEKNLHVEGDLKREIYTNIKRLKDIGCYRGVRHRKGLPVRGQRTKQNARTCKGPKRLVSRKKQEVTYGSTQKSY